MQKNGFTLIELLGVVFMIVILASMLILYLNGYRDKALSTNAKYEMSQYENAIIIARQQSHLRLRDITGSVWSAGPCICNTVNATGNDCSDYEQDVDLRGLTRASDPGTAGGGAPTTQKGRCWQSLFNAAQAIQNATGGVVKGLINSAGTDLGPVAVDPWNSPYLVDENEGEDPAPDYCRADYVYSNGPDGKDSKSGAAGTAADDNIITYIQPVTCSNPTY